MCLYPRIIRNKKYEETKKNGGHVGKPRDLRTLYVPRACGECIECMKKKKREWQVRLAEEIKTDRNATFVTLTFSNDAITKLYNDKRINNLKGYSLDNAAATLATRLFLERIRKETTKSIKHWLITELGHKGTENIHLHGLIWSTDTDFIRKKWQYGWVYCGKYVNSKTINYISKYITKQDVQHKTYKPKLLTSAGIGRAFITTKKAEENNYKAGQTKEYYQDEKGYKKPLPQYYKNHIYTDEQKENLWIEKLDNNERYILGQKINIAEDGIEQYYKVLKSAQEKNERLGYGKGQTKWRIANYEAERRAIQQAKRMNQAKTELPNPPVIPLIEAVEPLGPRSVLAGVGVLPAVADRSSFGAPPQIEKESNAQALIEYIKKQNGD